MSKVELDNLVKIGSLKAELASRGELDGMLRSARLGAPVYARVRHNSRRAAVATPEPSFTRRAVACGRGRAR